jgi:predicted GH43/DUF377 family glycosyl hydrolase
MLDIKDEGIILEKTSLSFEAKGVLNPACIKVGKTTHMFYRAISKDDISSIGYCQLINNRVVKRLNRPVLFPEHDYERKGIKDPRIVLAENWERIGNVDNVVFPTGAVIDKNRLYIYYGAADKLIALKSVGLEELLHELKTSN